MVGWISAGVVVIALVLLVAILVSVGGRLRPLQRAVRRLQYRLEQAQQAQAPGVARLEQQATELEAALAEMQERSVELQDSVQALREARATWPGADRAART